MDVKIKKDGNTKKYRLVTKWENVTLEKWAKIIAKDTKSKPKETLEMITALSDIPKKLVRELSMQDVAAIMSRIAQIQADTKGELKRIIKVDGKEYGFHPDLDEITLGEYADIDNYIDMGLEGNLANLMAVLYRPIVEKEGDVYTIEAYDTKDFNLRAEAFKKMKAREVNSSLLFFWTFVKELLPILTSYLTQRQIAIMKSQQMNNLQKNGVGLA